MSSDTLTRCEARVFLVDRRLASDARDWLASCELDADHGPAHQGRLDHEVETYDGLTMTRPVITWDDHDRRSFRGTFPGACNYSSGPIQPFCVLPAGHPGRHAA